MHLPNKTKSNNSEDYFNFFKCFLTVTENNNLLHMLHLQMENTYLD